MCVRVCACVSVCACTYAFAVIRAVYFENIPLFSVWRTGWTEARVEAGGAWRGAVGLGGVEAVGRARRLSGVESDRTGLDWG